VSHLLNQVSDVSDDQLRHHFHDHLRLELLASGAGRDEAHGLEQKLHEAIVQIDLHLLLVP
jgi:hypothetical protein